MEAVEIRKLTVAEFHEMEFDDHDTHLYEFLDGEIVKKNGPAFRTQPSPPIDFSQPLLPG